MTDLNKDFLGKFAQKEIDICEPIEGFNKAPYQLVSCVDELIRKYIYVRNHIKYLEAENDHLRSLLQRWVNEWGRK